MLHIGRFADAFSDKAKHIANEIFFIIKPVLGSVYLR